MIEYRELNEAEIDRELFGSFIRRQVVTDCWRRVDGEWVIKSDPFVDDWSGEDYVFLVECLKHTVSSGGFVCGILRWCAERVRFRRTAAVRRRTEVS